MVEGQKGGGLLRRESRKHFVGWKGVLGVVNEVNGPDQHCQRRAGGCWFKTTNNQLTQRLGNKDEECRNVCLSNQGLTSGEGERSWFSNNNARDNHSNAHLDDSPEALCR